MALTVWLTRFWKSLRAAVFRFSPSARVPQLRSDRKSAAEKQDGDRLPIPVSVNYHFTRECNYNCRFCFHTNTSSHLATVADAKKALLLFRDAGMEKVNFSGGEPFLKPKFLEQLVRYCKEELHVAVSIVSNGSLIREDWLKRNAKCIDYIAISCDSTCEETCLEIGRHDRAMKGDHVGNTRRAAELIKRYGVRLRLNTTVTKASFTEDMHELIQQLQPDRWKVFQCLPIDGENIGPTAKKDARDLPAERRRVLCLRGEALRRSIDDCGVQRHDAIQLRDSG
jgi:radical S-adenosyl methionine domain-containing protein 2